MRDERPHAGRRVAHGVSFQIGAPRWGGVSRGREYGRRPAPSSSNKRANSESRIANSEVDHGAEPPATSQFALLSELHADGGAHAVDADIGGSDVRHFDVLPFAAHEHVRHKKHIDPQAGRVSPIKSTGCTIRLGASA